MTRRLGLCVSLTLLMAFVIAPSAGAGQGPPPAPTDKDKCPVCGMFVYKYPDWVASARVKGGRVFYFDGPKDMLKYYLAPENKGAIETIYVTDYYDLDAMDARSAYYVQGGDVLGPMGRELIPFKDEASAREFMRDHGGRRVLPFDAITPELVRGLDE